MFWRILHITDSQQFLKTRDAFVHVLTANDGDKLQMLFEKCTDYFELIQGYPAGPAESQSLFSALPEGKAYKDKYLLGVFSNATDWLVGIIDLIRDFPTCGEWMLGLMLLDPDYRALGIGSQVFQAITGWCQSSGAASIRLGVVEDNTAAVRFWQTMGFKEIDRKPFQHHGSKDHTTIVMRRHLDAIAPNLQ